jgi:hypothetical protein
VDDLYVFEYETMWIDNVCECVFDMWTNPHIVYVVRQCG